MVYVNTINNPFEPFESEKEFITSGISIHNYLSEKYSCEWEAFDRPTLCMLNGEAVSQKEFKLTTLKDNDILCFAVLAGGIETIIVLAITVIASVAAVYIASSIAQPPGVVNSDTKSPDSVYNLNGQLNAAKLGQEIPCGYGRVRNWPDFAARPYNLYKSNEQYQFSLYCLGHGAYDIDDIKIGETSISNFTDIEYEIVPPNQKIDLFRDSVVTSIEASALEMLGPNEDDYEELGPFIVNATGTRVNKIEVDLSFPRGLYEQKDDGTLGNLTVTALINYREIDDDGDPVSNPTLYKATKTVTEIYNDNNKWVVSSVVYDEVDHAHPNGYKTHSYVINPPSRTTVYYILRSTTWELVSFSKSLKSVTPRRFTVEIQVPYGRYEIKFARNSNKFTNHRFSNTLMLEALRGFMPNTSYYGNKTLLAVKALASNNLNNNSAKQLNLIQTRKLRTWNGSAWTSEAETRNPIWAVTDVLTATYGGRIDQQYIDLTTLKSLADFCDTNDIYFDYIFASRSNVWDIIKTILAVGKMTPVLSSSRVSAIRDYELEFPEYIYTDDNIIKGSFRRSIAMKKLSDYDGLQVEFIDGTTFKQETVSCLVDDDAGTNIETIKLLGITDKNRAKRMGLYHRAIKKYRREVISFKTDAQGYLPTVNSLVGICHNTTKYRSFDLVKSVAGDFVTLSKKHTFDDSETYQIIFKQRTGFASPVYIAIPDSEFTDTLEIVELDEDLSRLDGEEPLICQFGETDKLNKLLRVKSINPLDLNSVEIECVTNDNRIYGFDEIDDDPTEEFPGLGDEDSPEVGEVTVRYVSLDSSQAVVSWPLNKSAKSYILQYSYDDETYSEVAVLTTNTYIFAVIPGQLYIRVAGVNKGQGAWSTWDGILAEFTAVPEQIDGVQLKHEIDDSIVLTWNPDMNCQEYIIKAYIGWSSVEDPDDFAGEKIVKAGLTKQLLDKSLTVEFTKEWLKDRCEKKEIFFGRQWTFFIYGRNTIGTGDPSEAFICEKESPATYLPTSLTDVDVGSGNQWDVGWTETGNPPDSVYYKVWSSIVDGSYPPVDMTLRKKTKKNAVRITITATTPHYWRVQVLDDWDTDEAVIATSQKTFT